MQTPDAASSLELPPLDDVLDGVRVVSLPMRNRFRGQQAREALLLHGPAGWGEFAPFLEYSPEESSAWLRAGLEAAWTGWGRPSREAIPINATMPAVGPEQVEGVLRRFGAPERIPAVKVKVAEPGQRLDDDLARFREVRRLVPRAGLRADANGAWSQAEAVRALAALAEVAGEGLEYVEQPVAGVEPLAELREELVRRGLPVRIAADEAVRKAEDPLRVAALGAADLIVVKAAPLGGVESALAVVTDSGMPAVVSSALDTSVGIAAGLALAARLPELPYACGLGTAALFAADVVSEPLLPSGGELTVPLQAGRITAPTPAPELLRAHRVSSARDVWWRDRLRAAYEVLLGE